jgi:predicted nucleic-acid-binding Zn-ribbon protein
MVHCPECEATLESMDDVAFDDTESRIGFVRASKRFYVVECAHCGYSLGSGVAGAGGGGGGAAGAH